MRRGGAEGMQETISKNRFSNRQGATVFKLNFARQIGMIVTPSHHIYIFVCIKVEFCVCSLLSAIRLYFRFCTCLYGVFIRRYMFYQSDFD